MGEQALGSSKSKGEGLFGVWVEPGTERGRERWWWVVGVRVQEGVGEVA